eukprot:2741057-Prymnesium_polylepis.1
MPRGVPCVLLLLASASALQLLPPTAPRAACERRRATPPAMREFDAWSMLKGSFERLTDFRVARASHILLKSFDDAAVEQMRQWKAQIADDPEAFATIARESSQCPSRAKGARRPAAPAARHASVRSRFAHAAARIRRGRRGAGLLHARQDGQGV